MSTIWLRQMFPLVMMTPTRFPRNNAASFCKTAKPTIFAGSEFGFGFLELFPTKLVLAVAELTQYRQPPTYD